LIGEGGILALGAAGIQVNPNDDTAHLLKSAIEARTKIKVDVSGIPRQPGDLNPTMLVIGPKPMAGDVVSPVADELQPMTLENILADFQLLDDWEDRYRYVIELGRALPLLPETKFAAAPVRSGSRPRSMAPPPGPRRASASRATATPISCGG